MIYAIRRIDTGKYLNKDNNWVNLDKGIRFFRTARHCKCAYALCNQAMITAGRDKLEIVSFSIEEVGNTPL